MPTKEPGILLKIKIIIYTMEDDTLKDIDEDLEPKLPHDIEKGGDALDEDPESIDELAEEEEEEEEPFDDINPL